MQKTKLDYVKGDDDHFRISASGISRYFTGTSSWYKENLLGEDGFKGSTSSVLGTICHFGIECYVKNEDFDLREVNQYLENQATLVEDLDINYINLQYPIMLSKALYWVSENIDTTLVTSEAFMEKQLLPGITVGGSCDLHSDNTVYDWKTYSAKQPPKTITYAYKLQALTYAKLLIDKGYNIQYMSIVYISTDIIGEISEKTGKQLKSYPSDVTVLTEAITPEDLEMIGNIHQLIAESVEWFRDTPALRHIIGQDLRLVGCHCTLPKPIDEEI